MSKSIRKAPAETAGAAQYRVTLKEPITVGRLTLRPGKTHIVSGRVLEANRAKVETHEAL